MPDLRRVCAWCKDVLDSLGPVNPGETVTHGICATCQAEVLAQLEQLEQRASVVRNVIITQSN